MKIEKRFCDVCGEEMKEKHPLRLAVQEYVTSESETWKGTKTNSRYNNRSTYDICGKCEAYLPNLLRGLRDEENRK